MFFCDHFHTRGWIKMETLTIAIKITRTTVIIIRFPSAGTNHYPLFPSKLFRFRNFHSSRFLDTFFDKWHTLTMRFGCWRFNIWVTISRLNTTNGTGRQEYFISPFQYVLHILRFNFLRTSIEKNNGLKQQSTEKF